MGDDLSQRQTSSDNVQNRLRDKSPHSQAYDISQQQQHQEQQQPSQRDMEFETYAQQPFPMAQYGGPTMDMRGLAGALPDYSMRQYQSQPPQQQFHSQGGSNQHLMYQYQSSAQFAGQTATNYNPNLGQQYHAPYVQHHGGRPQQPGFAGFQTVPAALHTFQGQNAQMQQDFNQSQAHNYLQIPSGQYQTAFGGRGATGFQQPQMRQGSNVQLNQALPMYQQMIPQPIRRTSSNSSLQASTIRGPPRKPKQSGHALWVGNLPPGTHIIDLKDHFSRDATNDIESVFLISKSNCAFVNYKTETSCAAAMSRFHDSRFQGVRLVCRLRRGSASAASTTQPLAVIVPSSSTIPEPSSESKEAAPAEESAVVDGATATDSEPAEKAKEKFFVVKSLTIEDLERSVQTGVWATQAHNEEALNKAYRATENVYLIFSANKSGEYFGYARMDSAIDDEASAQIDAPLRPEPSEPTVTDLPLTIPTPATATAPKGRIIDDSARGTIFWEADSEEKDEQKDDETGNNSGYDSAMSGGGASPATPQTFGKPFKIVWVSTERLPFYRTRGLRNPWNANREVKIARDGTEIEPSVGRRLVGMFHRPHVASASPGSRPPPGMMAVPSGYIPQPQLGQMHGNPYGRSY